MNRVVLDTNCLIASLSKRGKYFQVWKDLHAGKYVLCVSDEILNEYEEIISTKVNARIAANVVQTLLNSSFVYVVNPYYRFNLIEQDKDDNKFVDCAIAANAKFIVSEDHHFSVLKTIDFPKVDVIGIDLFLNILKSKTYPSSEEETSSLLNEPI